MKWFTLRFYCVCIYLLDFTFTASYVLLAKYSILYINYNHTVYPHVALNYTTFLYHIGLPIA